jgi:hypothetical protein
MITFEDILHEELQNIVSKEFYVQYWDRCVQTAIKALQDETIELDSIDHFIDFFILGINNNEIYKVLKYEYIYKLIGILRDSYQKYAYRNQYNLFYLLDLELMFCTKIVEKEILINKYNDAIITNLEFDKNTKIYLINLNNSLLSSNRVKTMKMAKLVLNICEKEVFSKEISRYFVEKSSFLMKLLYQYRLFDELIQVTELFKKINTADERLHLEIKHCAYLRQIDLHVEKDK